MKNLKSILLAALIALPVIASAQVQFTTNEQGQVSIVSGSFTNFDQLVVAVKKELADNAPKGLAGIGSTVIDYFSKFNPALSNVFVSNKGYAFAGVDSISGGSVSLANSLCVDYKIWGGLALDALTRNSGVSGTVISQSAGLALNIPIKDVNIAFYGHGGYDLTKEDTIDALGTVTKADHLYGEFGFRAMKALSAQTFMGVGLSEIFPGSETVVTATVGFVF